MSKDLAYTTSIAPLNWKLLQSNVQNNLFSDYRKVKHHRDYFLSLLDQSISPSDVANCHYWLSRIYLTLRKYESCFIHANQACKQFSAIGDMKGKTRSLLLKASAYIFQDKNEQALQILRNILRYCIEEGLSFEKAKAIHSLGIYFFRLGQYDIARRYYIQSLFIRESIKDQAGIAESLHDLGVLHYYSNQHFSAAIELFQRSLAIRKSIGDEVGVANVTDNLAYIYEQSMDYKRALSLYKKSYYIRKKVDDVYGLVQSLNNIGNIHILIEETQKSIGFFDKALAISEQFDDWQGQIKSHIYLGKNYAIHKEYDRALSSFEVALKTAEIYNDTKQYVLAVLEKSIVYIEQKDFITARFLLKENIPLVESLKSRRYSARMYSLLGEISYRLGDYHEAFKDLAMATEIWKKIHGKKELAQTSYFLSLTYAELGAKQKAIECFQEGIRIGKDILEWSLLEKMYKKLSELYRQLGSHKEASYTMEQCFEAYKKYTNNKMDAAQQAGDNEQIEKELWTNNNTEDILAQALNTKSVDELEYKNLKLEKKIKTSTRQLEDRNEQFRRFAHTIAHDLKEPLRSVHMFTRILSNYLGDNTDEVLQEYIQHLSKDSLRVHKLLDDLLHLSSSTKPVGEIKSVDINKTMRMVLNMLDVSVQLNKVDIRVGILPTIQATEEHMIQLFKHLIQNAIKYRSSKRSCSIIIDSDEHVDHYLIRVKDNCLGIPFNEQEKVFDIFHKRDVENGTGLGLAICKNIVNTYGGEIWLKSKDDVGSVFYILFPKKED